MKDADDFVERALMAAILVGVSLLVGWALSGLWSDVSQRAVRTAMNEAWSWILTAVGVTGFILAGRKVWWAWYVNLACQGLWFAYAVATQQYGFLVAAALYTVVFTQNALAWTREHRQNRKVPE